MIHLAVNFFVFIFVAIGAFGLFVAYLIGQICRGIFLAFSRLTGTGNRYRIPPMHTRRCSRLRCGARNPAEANYCRRCGSPLGRPFARTQPDRQAANRKWVSSSVSL